ncbi:MAG: ABC transporter substrate-binding protein [Alphaproteobacteria bacterium]|jgi:branched-chain amino acid transport system substrate-binding protein|nr:ABC transporter substrate-binding protein [Alphaproteobacteria bacterium]
MKILTTGLLAVGVALGAATTAVGTASAAGLTIGFQCDRTGPTQTVGVFICRGYHDYMKLFNSRGGVDGAKIRVIEIDHEYKVPPAVEAYHRFKKEGAILISLYGTPQTQALTSNLHDDKIPGTSPGFGSAAAANGQKYPFLFPMAASYWSQAAAAVEFAKNELGGNIKGKKIAYIYYDNPAGREPLPILESLQKSQGFEMRSFAIPPPGVEMKVQVQDITRRYRADFVISHLFGKGPAVHIKEFKRMGYPLTKLVSLVWGAGEADINGAGGWDKAQGYNGMHFAGVGSDYEVLDDIRALYKSEGKAAPKEMSSTVYYNRGVLMAAVHAEAISNAVKAKGSASVTGSDVQKGFEMINGFSLGGLVPPLNINSVDHEGGGWVQIFRVEGNKFVPKTDWMQGYRDVVMDMVKTGHK